MCKTGYATKEFSANNFQICCENGCLKINIPSGCEVNVEHLMENMN